MGREKIAFPQEDKRRECLSNDKFSFFPFEKISERSMLYLSGSQVCGGRKKG